MSPDLRALTKQERFCFDTLNNVVEFINQYDEAQDKGQIAGWMDRLEGLFENFLKVRLQIDLLQDDESPTADEEEKRSRASRDRFEKIYVQVKGFLVNAERTANAVPSTSAVAGSGGSHANRATPMARIKLPEVKLPSFSGSVTEWLTFRDTFKSLIDSNPNLSDVDKFSYLVASLTGEAKRVVEPIDITDANYAIAWQSLTKRFDNKKLVVKTYIDALLSVEPLKRESYESLSRLIDDFERNLQMIEKMNIDTKGWSVLLAHIVCSRLDSATLKQWENHHKSTDVPRYEVLIDFLRSHCIVLQSIAPGKARASDPPRSDPARVPKIKSSHSPFKCDVFRKLAVSERYDLVKKRSLCINCLSADHQVRSCPSGACRVCSQKHHTMLHQQAPIRNPPQPQGPKSNSSQPPANQTQYQPQIAPTTSSNANKSSSPSIVPDEQTPSTSALSHCSTSSVANVRRIPSTVLLQTALVKVIDSSRNTLWARALLDPASQLNIISESLAQRLQVQRVKEHHIVGGIGQSSTTSTHSIVVHIQSHCCRFRTQLKFHVLSAVTRELPSNSIDVAEWNWPTGVILADPQFNKPAAVDMIIGVDAYYDMLLDGLIRLGPGRPVLQNTLLGWVVSGRAGNSRPDPEIVSIVHVCSTDGLEQQLSRFWELESCQSSSTLSVEESTCEAHFVATTTRAESGRFVVQLPKKPSILSQMGDSYDIAKRRFLSVERRLQAKPQLKTAYSAFIEEYRILGHMKEVVDVSQPTPYRPYYLPHHCIERPDSVTTKLRVVFDASCATDTNVSLNNALMVGPTVQDDLFSLILRWRTHRYVIIADIEKMYRQIQVHPSDQCLQRILWRDDPSEPIRIFELSTVTYGTSSAPYLATRCLKELSVIGRQSHPLAAEVVGEDFYMDDLFTGSKTIRSGRVLCTQLLQLLHSAGFPLRKWSSNSPEILSHIPETLRDERTVLGLDPGASIKTLGLRWEPASDCFGFHVPKWKQDICVSKRQVVSDSSSLFDPLGFIGPVIVVAKLFVQDLWRSKRSWDEPLEDELQQSWLQFRSELAAIETIIVPRWAVPIVDPTFIELHGFCDASEKAYGACIYLRAVSSNGNTSVRLLTSKSKLAPLGNSKKQKRVCLPRLELSSALLLSHLVQKVQEALNLQMKCFFWTDSMIVLQWISAAPSRWKTFVANRVSEIQHLTEGGLWNHVPGIENPADIISRGMLPAELRDCAAWWNGPPWLSQPNRFWPALVRPAFENFEAEQLEERAIVLPIQVHEPNPIFSLRSSYTGLVSVVAYLLRFCHNCKQRNPSNRRTGFLKTTEYKDALMRLVRLAQQESLTDDVKAVAATGEVKPNSKLKSLAPILEDGILKVGGRLRNAPVTETRKHPMILSTSHPFTKMVVTHYHQKLLHAGPQLLIAHLREQFWPLRVRNLARKVVQDCIRCYRCKPTVQEQLMGDLPSERVTPTYPFLKTGVDLCGPLFYRHHGRKSPPVKCYVAIFVCLVTKAVHIELVADLTTDAFISALKRFIARRSKPAVIECDNAKNFQGASRALAELLAQFRSQQHQHSVGSFCVEEGIEFKFIPPRSPNFGGLWEAAVKSFKKHLKSTIGTTVLYKDDLETLLVQIESCLNSRPLTQLSTDPEDLEVLTPGHFLVLRPLVAAAEPSYEEIPQNRLNRYQMTQEFVRRIWKRWSTDYLSGLHPRTKWTRQRDNLAVGTLVLLKDEKLPPLRWCLGRVTRLFYGDDGNVRVVSVRTKDGEFNRAISKVCVLPIQQLARADEDVVLADM
ncbi:uncharacterized protein LOC134286948 [Aedes albopictus]|uniref:Integrase catalytic domain-containing protein n=1 Tax=Aedes albopictus TaxID=7160 RepID=A0ABM1ZG43_AEDAL